jgi:hypothetical protein
MKCVMTGGFSGPPLSVMSKSRATAFFPLLGVGGRKPLQDKAMQRQTSTNQRDAPGQDTGLSEGHLSSYLLGGAPGPRGEAPGKM